MKDEYNNERLMLGRPLPVEYLLIDVSHELIFYDVYESWNYDDDKTIHVRIYFRFQMDSLRTWNFYWTN